MRSRIEIAVYAAPQTIFDLARDVPHWPEMLPHYQKVTVLSRDRTAATVGMRAVRRFGPLAFPVGWRSRFWAEPDDPADLRLRFVHVAGVTRGMDVTWHIKPNAVGGSDVAIEHDFTRPLPGFGPDALPRLVDALFVRPIAGRTLATFKKLAEERQ